MTLAQLARSRGGRLYRPNRFRYNRNSDFEIEQLEFTTNHAVARNNRALAQTYARHEQQIDEDEFEQQCEEEIFHTEAQNGELLISPSGPGCPRCEKTPCVCYKREKIENALKAFSGLATASQLVLNTIRIIRLAMLPSEAQVGIFSPFTNAANSITNMADDVKTFSNTATSSMSQITDTLAGTHTKITEKMDHVEYAVRDAISAIPAKITEMMESTFSFIPISLKGVFKLATTCCIVYITYQLLKNTWSIAKCLLDIIAAALQLPTHILDILRNYISFDITEAQIAGTPESLLNILLPNIAPLFATLLTAGVLGKLPSKDKSPDNIMRRMRDFPGACRGLADIFRYIREWWSLALTTAQECIYGPDPMSPHRGIPEIEKWIAELSTYTTREGLASALSTTEGALRVSQMFMEGVCIQRAYFSTLTLAMKDQMRTLLIVASKLKSEAEKCGVWSSGVRMEPQCLWLTGGSGIGKSTIQYRLATHALRPFGVAKDVDKHVYVRCPEQDFWDGYRGQWVVVYDDGFQLRDEKERNPEIFEIIRGQNVFPAALPMANLEDKANTRFQAKCIIVSSNVRNFKIESINYEEALFRRFTHSYHVTIKQEYRMLREVNGRMQVVLDVQKARDEAPIINGVKAAVNTNVYNFIPFDACADRHTRIDENAQGLSYDEVVAEMERDMVERIRRGKTMVNDIQNYANRIAQEPRAYDTEAQIGDQFYDAEAPQTRSINDFFQFLLELHDQEEPLSDQAMQNDFLRMELLSKPMDDKVDVELLLTEHWDADFPFFYNLFRQHQIRRHVPREMSMHQKLFLKARQAFENTKRQMQAAYETVVSCDWRKMVRDSLSFLDNHLTTIGAMSVAALAFYLWKQWKPTVESQSCTKNQQPKYKPTSRFTTKHKAVTAKAKTEGQVRADQQAWNVMEMVRRQQYMLLAVANSGDIAPLGTATLIKGSLVLLPAHFYAWIEGVASSLKCLRFKNKTVEIDISVSDFLSDDRSPMIIEDNDIMLISMHRYLPAQRDLTKHFTSVVAQQKIEGSANGVLSMMKLNEDQEVEFSTASGVITPHDKKEYRLTIPKYDQKGKPETNILGAQVMNYQPLVSRNVYNYQMITQKGDCGAILYAHEPTCQQKILGMHVAGGGGLNWSVAVTCEMLEDLISGCSAEAQCCAPFESQVANVTLPFSGAFHPVGVLDGPGETTRSALIPATLHNQVFETVTKPAYLRPFTNPQGETIDPMLKGVEKLGKRCGLVDRELLDVVSSDVLRTMEIGLGERRPAVTTYEVAVQGVPGNDLMNGVSRVTSPGWPWINKKGKKKGKTTWMGEEDYEFDTVDAHELRTAVFELVDKARTSQPLDIVFLDTLKDEKRPIAKVDAGKTRVFSNGPMHFTVAFRMYFLEFIAHMMENKIENGSAIGIDPFSKDWEELHRYLQSVGDKMIAGDFGQFDGTLIRMILFEIVDMINRWYDDGEENATIRRNLWSSVVFATHYVRGMLYRVDHGIPSGFPATSIVNTLYNLYSFRICYLMLAPPAYRSISQFHQHVKLVAYGDDNILNVSDEIASWFTMAALTQVFADLGMEYTDEAKTGKLVDFRPITEVSFLKRTWLWSPLLGRHTCPADLNSRLDMLNWTRSNRTDQRAVEMDTIQEVLKELAAHGKDVFNTWTPRIVKACRASNMYPIIESFATYHVCAAERL
jgi:hypothetical protein